MEIDKNEGISSRQPKSPFKRDLEGLECPFDKLVTRRGTNSYKWDCDEMSDDVIPLWVADMDFETAPCIQQALIKRMQHGCFGYTAVPQSYYDATVNWFSRRHGWTPKREWFIYTSGVVPALSAIIKAMTAPGDKVLVCTPVYNCFFSSIRNNGCQILESKLAYENQHYTVDWEDFECKCADPDTKLFILCNPHNPAGRVWTSEELHRIGEICKKHDVFVIADEIHCEFAFTRNYTPFAAASDAQCAVCVSPSKAFNIAGLQIANIIIADDQVREKVNKAININEVCDVNPFGVIALQAAYSEEGEEWLMQLNQYIYDNYKCAKAFLEDNSPKLKVTELEGTYLMWVDISATCKRSDTLEEELLANARVFVNAGTMYGEEAGKNFIRINLACPRSRLLEGLTRISEYLK